MRQLLFLLLLAASCLRCQPDQKTADTPSPEALPALTPNGVNAVVEIPAGTNHKIEYDKSSGKFLVDQRNGKERVIDFLPYPGNYGFIPSTYMAPERGGDGDALDVLVIGEAQPTGQQLEVLPIGSLKLRDGGEADTKIIAIPADRKLQVIDPKDFVDFSIRYDGAKHIIENWFLYYDGLGNATLEGWEDERAAMETIKRWQSASSSEE